MKVMVLLRPIAEVTIPVPLIPYVVSNVPADPQCDKVFVNNKIVKGRLYREEIMLFLY